MTDARRRLGSNEPLARAAVKAGLHSTLRVGGAALWRAMSAFARQHHHQQGAGQEPRDGAAGRALLRAPKVSVGKRR
jgi:hypothetical protein